MKAIFYSLIKLSGLACALPASSSTYMPAEKSAPQKVVIKSDQFNEYYNSARAGDDEAMRCLAVCYQTGTGTDKNLDEAITWYGKAARLGNSEAQYDIGTLYRDGIGFRQDYAEAAYWFRKAASNGNVKAMIETGRAFLEGKGVLPDDVIASEYFWRAGSRGSAEGQYAYAMMLRDGRGVKADRLKAQKWFDMAAEQKYKDAAAQAESLRNHKSAYKAVTKSNGIRNKKYNNRRKR